MILRACMLSCLRCICFCETLWTVNHQAPLSMGFSRQEYRSGLLCLLPGDLPDPEIKPISLCLLHVCTKSLQSCANQQTIAFQALLSLGFSKGEYRSGLLCPSPGDLPDPGIEPASLTSLALAGRFFTTSATWETQEFWSRGLEISVIHSCLYILGGG